MQTAKPATMQERIIIIGAGGFGREVVEYLHAMLPQNPSWKFAGFLDQNPNALPDGKRFGRVIGSPDTYQPKPQDRFVCAMGNPRIKIKICKEIRNRGGQFANIIHPTAVVSPHCNLGTGIVVSPFCLLSPDVEIADDVSINVHCCIGHDAQIGAGCTLSPHCDVTGYAVLEQGVFLGSHASITPSVRVEEFATIGAGSVAVSKVRAGQTVFGVPAKRLSPLG